MKTYRLIVLISLITVPLVAGEALADRQTSLTAPQIQKVVRKGKSGVSRCYSLHAMKQKKADGRVTLHLGIRSSGKVDKIDIEAPTVHGKKFSRCVTRTVRKWRFPRAVTGTDVSYPFRFVHTHARGAGPKRHRGKRR